MTIRSRRETVTFKHPFRIHGIERVLRPGAYQVIADEERLESETVSAWRRVGTSIIVPAESPAGTMEMLSIRASDLADAIASDASIAND
ncbi:MULTISPECIES: hypothetical protein [unclassified Bradyrhizobium]|uniref:hypothetical protein n=1 Tax=unclassified Bradyrhizobium TaxID=2631580 RepID=UPI001C65361F|nr:MULTISPECIES: hypothetical protein [unclassified Bradyrhizobium]MBW7961537.1 hypothetical protein [Bradyrhizobium sp. BR 10261]MDA9412607.1 hypothetical protein [Bradyrhizobium sp. CCBAU 45384]MDA9443055.1 hypothetical protein [Bradyrhizobium sp. CCBAU 51745]